MLAVSTQLKQLGKENLNTRKRYLTIIQRARVGYEMIDSAPRVALIIPYYILNKISRYDWSMMNA